MSSLKTNIFNSIEEIHADIWKDLSCQENVYFSYGFLEAFESSNPNIDFRYIVISSEDKAIALALIQTIELSIDVILKNIKLSKFIKRIFNFFFCNNPIRIMFCGNIFLSGEHGIYMCNDVDKVSVLNTIALTIKYIAKQCKPLHAIFIKDYLKSSLDYMGKLKNYGYTAMQVEPNLIVRLDKNWNNFSAYRDNLKSKYRVKVNRADAMSSALTDKLFAESDFATYKNELQKLYENTIANANFNAQVLNLDTYIKLRAIYHENFIVKAYFYNDKLVGFLSALANNNHLDAHFIGLDYELNKTYAIYPRILNDYIRIGIEKKVSHINLGRTASEIKTTIGANPVDLTCFIRHRRSLLNTLLKPLIKNVKIKSFKQHQPFKNKKEA